MKKSTLLFICCLGLILKISAQIPFFPYNLYRYNPAAMSKQECVANAEYVAYSTLTPGFNKVTDVNIQKRIPKLHSTLGFDFYNHTLGEGDVFRRNYNFSYAYEWKLGNKENSPNLALAIQSGVFYGWLLRKMWNGDYAVYNGLRANLNTGLFFCLPQEKFYAGFSVNDMIQRLWYADDIPLGLHPTSYQFISGYRFRIKPQLTLQPNMLIKITSPYSDFHSNIQIQHLKWEWGVNYAKAHFYMPYYNDPQTLLGMNVGVCLKKRFYLRYSYNRHLASPTNQIGYGTHGLMLSYRSIK